MQPIKGEKDAASLTEINFGRTDLMEFGRKKKENPEESSWNRADGKDAINLFCFFSQSC